MTLPEQVEIFEAESARESAERFMAEASTLTVTTNEDLAAAAELREAIKRAERQSEADREALKRPVLEEGRRIDSAFAPAKQAFTGALGIVDRAIRGFREREEARRRAEEMARRQAAEQERQRLEKLAAKAETKGQAETADRLQREAEMVPVPTVESRVAKVDGLIARKVWRFEITDKAAVPDRYKAVDETAVRKVIQALGAEHGIPGVRAWQEEEFSTRSSR